MSTSIDQVAGAFTRKVADNPELTHSSVRIGLWLISLASKVGGFPVDVYAHHFANGYNVNGVRQAGVGARFDTTKKGIKELEDAGLLMVEEGGRAKHAASNGRRFTIMV